MQLIAAVTTDNRVVYLVPAYVSSIEPLFKAAVPYGSIITMSNGSKYHLPELPDTFSRVVGNHLAGRA